MIPAGAGFSSPENREKRYQKYGISACIDYYCREFYRNNRPSTMTLSIENQDIKASFQTKGAELTHLTAFGADRMWSGDPAFWGKHSPVLFPIVGALRDNTYFYEGKSYSLGRHGFARDREFAVVSQTGTEVVFGLTSDEESKKVYPFDFDFRIRYTLSGNRLEVAYSVHNTGGEVMWFSVGGHPAFAVPVAEGTSYEDYYLEFSETEDFNRWPLAGDGLIGAATEPVALRTNRIPLTKELFYGDALVFKHLKSTSVTLKSDKTPRALTFDYAGFPYLGIWAAKNAPFVCIEPWCGIADSFDHNQQLTEKEGINRLEAGEVFSRVWSVALG
jgi:galactose mutarotase-like enzyme